MNLPMVQCMLWSVVEAIMNIEPGLKKGTTLVWMNLPMVQCMLWSVVETIMNIQHELKNTPHWYEPSNGTMYTMVCCRDHHEYWTWTKKKATTLVGMNLPMVQCMLWSVVETIMNIEPGLKKGTTLVWMNLPMVQCMLWSVVETIMNIQPGLKNIPH
jgi:hypothetical protein